MKKILIMLLSVSLLSACNNNQGKNGILGGVGGKKTSRDKDDDYKKNNKDDDYTNRDDDNGRGGWTSADRNNFMQACNAQASSEICSCVLQKLEKKYKNLADADERGGEQAGMDLSRQCLNEGNGGNLNNNGRDDDRYTDDRDNNRGDGWTSAQRREWVNVCATSAENGGMQRRKAEGYCSCVQEKLEMTNPDYEAANRTSQAEMQQMTNDCIGVEN